MNNSIYIPDEIWKHILEFSLPATTHGDTIVDNSTTDLYRNKIKKFSTPNNNYNRERASKIMFKKYGEIILEEFHKKIDRVIRGRKKYHYIKEYGTGIDKGNEAILRPIKDHILDIELAFFNTYKYNDLLRNAFGFSQENWRWFLKQTNIEVKMMNKEQIEDLLSFYYWFYTEKRKITPRDYMNINGGCLSLHYWYNKKPCNITRKRNVING